MTDGMKITTTMIGAGVQDDGNVQAKVGQPVNIALSHVHKDDPNHDLKLELVREVNRTLTKARDAGLDTSEVPIAFRAMIEGT